MKPFTETELRRIAGHADLSPITNPQDNPYQAASVVLREETAKEGGDGRALLMACIGFALGKATGVREERARRRREL